MGSHHGEIATKSRGERKVQIALVLRDYLDEHLLALEWKEGACIRRERRESVPRLVADERADRAWSAKKLPRITLHECRRTFASLMIAAGVNAKSLSTYMGHPGIAITLDRYGH